MKDLTKEELEKTLEDYDDYDREITLDELEEEIDAQWSLMSDQEKYCRMRDGDPTFLIYAHGQMVNKSWDKAIINENNQTIEKVSSE